MGAPGWDDAPAVKLARGEPKDITIIWPYYENPAWLERQLRYLMGLPESIRANLHLIVSDDGSPMNPAEPQLKLVGDLGLKSVRLFRIKVDIRWNWLAARNVAMKHCATWALCTDIDHVPPPDTLEALIHDAHQPGTIYRFGRVEHDGTPLHPHPNSFFLTPETFWKVGGYDENLSGCYGTDGDWRRRCAAAAPIRTLPEVLVRYEHQLDSSTTRYKRKQPEDARKKEIMRRTRRGKGWRPKVLSFPWREVT